MATGLTMEEMAGYLLAQCVSELVRIKVVEWSENGENGESVRANFVSPNLRESPPQTTIILALKCMCLS